jgi:SnoaL-like domain
MSAIETGADGIPALADRSLSHAEAVHLAESYVAAYNDRDREAMLALQDENVVSYPSPLFRMRRLTGHEGVRAWWKAMVASGRWYEVAVQGSSSCVARAAASSSHPGCLPAGSSAA